MEIKVAAPDRHGCVVVQVGGECDMTTAPELHERLLDLLARGPARIVLDLSGVDFLDCAGARALVAASRRAMLQDGMLAVAAPSPRVARLLQLTELDRSLTTHSSLDAALAATRLGARAQGISPRPGTRRATVQAQPRTSRRPGSRAGNGKSPVKAGAAGRQEPLAPVLGA